MFKKILIGCIAGIICGLFSAGGGLVLVPACVYFLDLDEKKSRSTSIFAIMFMVITAALLYNKDNYINWNTRNKMCNWRDNRKCDRLIFIKKSFK